MKFLAILALLAAGSCSPQQQLIVVEKHKVPDVPAAWFTCMNVNYPDYKTLTDRQVAKLIVDLSRANIQCRANMDAIRALIAKAKEAADKE